MLVDKSELWDGKPVKKLTEGESKAGRINISRIMVRRKGGGVKKTYCKVDFKRRKFDIEAKVERLSRIQTA